MILALASALALALALSLALSLALALALTHNTDRQMYDQMYRTHRKYVPAADR